MYNSNPIIGISAIVAHCGFMA